MCTSRFVSISREIKCAVYVIYILCVLCFLDIILTTTMVASSFCNPSMIQLEVYHYNFLWTTITLMFTKVTLFVSVWTASDGYD